MSQDSAAASTEHIDVRYVANLARLALTDEEAATFQRQLDDVVAYVRELRDVEVGDIEPTAHAVDVVNVLRTDEPRPGLSREVALRSAPQHNDEQFLVPPILE
jgi:aspartyl-tRNA(Asn)/glutamyl-tRNA(Gln) amidotransferase subunit C